MYIFGHCNFVQLGPGQRAAQYLEVGHSLSIKACFRYETFILPPSPLQHCKKNLDGYSAISGPGFQSTGKSSGSITIDFHCLEIYPDIDRIAFQWIERPPIKATETDTP